VGLEGRHILELSDDAEYAYNAWRDNLDIATQEQADFALGRPAKHAAFTEPAREVLVACDPSTTDWNSIPPRLQLAEAVDFLRQPFSLLLEDDISDWHFLLSFATPQERAFLLEKRRLNALKVEHGGGVTKMPDRVEAFLNDGRRYWRLFVLFDSDALQPGHPSLQTNTIHNLCQWGKREAQKPTSGETIVPFYRLTRRFAENYLTRAALNAWADETRYRPSHDAGAPEPAHVVEAYFGMEPAQRHHYNLKEGFAKDEGRINAGESVGTLYDNLTDPKRKHLKLGMKGLKLATLFEPRQAPCGVGGPAYYLVTESDLRDDGSWEEINSQIRRLLAHLH
jgi:hypothetical protein